VTAPLVVQLGSFGRLIPLVRLDANVVRYHVTSTNLFSAEVTANANGVLRYDLLLCEKTVRGIEITSMDINWESEYGLSTNKKAPPNFTSSVFVWTKTSIYLIKIGFCTVK